MCPLKWGNSKRHESAYAQAQSREAEALVEHVAHVHRRQFAWEADAEEAMAEYEGRGQGRRGRAATPWRYHQVAYRVEAHRQRQRRARRGRPRMGEVAPKKWCIGCA